MGKNEKKDIKADGNGENPDQHNTQTEKKIAFEKKTDEKVKAEPAKVKTTLGIYAFVLICVVVALLLTSFGVQLRENQRLAGMVQEQETAAKGATKNYERLQDENATLTTQNNELNKQITALEQEVEPVRQIEETLPEGATISGQLESLEAKYKALSDMSDLQRVYRKGTSAQCRVLISAMETKGISAYLTEDQKTEYAYIKRKVKYSK